MLFVSVILIETFLGYDVYFFQKRTFDFYNWKSNFQDNYLKRWIIAFSTSISYYNWVWHFDCSSKYREILCDDITAHWAMIKFVFKKCDGISGTAAMLF